MYQTIHIFDKILFLCPREIAIVETDTGNISTKGDKLIKNEQTRPVLPQKPVKISPKPIDKT